MKTLEQIKEEVSQDDNFQSWQELFESCARYDYGRLENAINEISKRYATEYAKEALRLASENASLIKESQYTGGLGLSGLLYEDTLVIDKQSILSENNLPKH